MPKRRKLGTVYELSPAQMVRNWIGENAGRFFFDVVICIIWVGVYYMVLGIVAFLMENIQQVENPPTAKSLLQTQVSSIIIVVGMILITIYVFRDLFKRKKKKN
jgi:hypothetical protein